MRPLNSGVPSPWPGHAVPRLQQRLGRAAADGARQVLARVGAVGDDRKVVAARQPVEHRPDQRRRRVVGPPRDVLAVAVRLAPREHVGHVDAIRAEDDEHAAALLLRRPRQQPPERVDRVVGADLGERRLYGGEPLGVQLRVLLRVRDQLGLVLAHLQVGDPRVGVRRVGAVLLLRPRQEVGVALELLEVHDLLAAVALDLVDREDGLVEVEVYDQGGAILVIGLRLLELLRRHHERVGRHFVEDGCVGVADGPQKFLERREREIGDRGHRRRRQTSGWGHATWVWL